MLARLEVPLANWSVAHHIAVRSFDLRSSYNRGGSAGWQVIPLGGIGSALRRSFRRPRRQAETVTEVERLTSFGVSA